MNCWVSLSWLPPSFFASHNARPFWSSCSVQSTDCVQTEETQSKPHLSLIGNKPRPAPKMSPGTAWVFSYGKVDPDYHGKQLLVHIKRTKCAWIHHKIVFLLFAHFTFRESRAWSALRNNTPSDYLSKWTGSSYFCFGMGFNVEVNNQQRLSYVHTTTGNACSSICFQWKVYANVHFRRLRFRPL